MKQVLHLSFTDDSFIFLHLSFADESFIFSHLFFGVVSFIFSNATLIEARYLKDVLLDYCDISGQLVNFDTSALFFPEGVVKRDVE